MADEHFVLSCAAHKYTILSYKLRPGSCKGYQELQGSPEDVLVLSSLTTIAEIRYAAIW